MTTQKFYLLYPRNAFGPGSIQPIPLLYIMLTTITLISCHYRILVKTREDTLGPKNEDDKCTR